MAEKLRQMTLEELAARLSDDLGSQWAVRVKPLPDGHVRIESTLIAPQ